MKKKREETEEALLKMLKVMINAMKTLRKWKKWKIKWSRYLINLLEDMSNKITKANDIL